MKEQISIGETDLRTTYILVSLIPIFIGILFLIFINYLDNSMGKENFLKIFSIGCLIFGIITLTISSIFVPYCYKIEVDNDKIYVTKSEIIITTMIEKTITIDKNELKSISGSFLGFSVFNWEYKLYYLNFYHETEFGKKIAFLSKLIPAGDDYFELRKLTQG